MDHRAVNGTALVMIFSAILAVATLALQSWSVALSVGSALVLPAIALYQVADIVKRQGERIAQLEQARGRPTEQPAPGAGAGV
jgi:hypothetical protein